MTKSRVSVGYNIPFKLNFLELQNLKYRKFYIRSRPLIKAAPVATKLEIEAALKQ